MELGAQPRPAPAALPSPRVSAHPAVPAIPSASPDPATQPAPAAEPYGEAYSQSSVAASETEGDPWLLSYVDHANGTDIHLAYRSDSRVGEGLRKKLGGNFIWFVHNGDAYVIRDPATVKAAYELFAPQETLGKRQAALGKQQEELGRRQEALGEQQKTVRVTIPGDLSPACKRSRRRSGNWERPPRRRT